MRYRVGLTAKAERDIDDVLTWLRAQRVSEATAEKWVSGILSSIATLEHDPLRCSRAEESDRLGLDVRQLLFGKRRGQYRILFRVIENRVEILHVRHTMRDWLDLGDLLG